MNKKHIYYKKVEPAPEGYAKKKKKLVKFTKTETVEEFLKRGGVVTKLETNPQNEGLAFFENSYLKDLEELIDPKVDEDLDLVDQLSGLKDLKFKSKKRRSK